MIGKKRLVWLIIYFGVLIHLVSRCNFKGVYGTEFFLLLISYILVGGLFCFVVLNKA